MAKASGRTADTPLRRFRPYRDYEDSGVDWLGGIPAHWEPARLWRLCSATSGATPTKENPAYWNGEIPWVSPKDMKRRVISTSEDLITQQALDETGIKLIAPQVVLVVVRGMILAHSFPVAVTAAPVTINQDMKALRLIDGVDAFYFAWALDGLARGIIATVVEEAAHGTRVIRMDQWRSLVVPLPPYPEQRAIAAFLDRETAKIDALVARKERLIELLQEKRTALITRAVTRGLDPNVPMKDSGVERLRQLPSHWTGLPLKRWVATSITDGPHETPQFLDEGVQFISAEAVSNGRIDFGRRRGLISERLHEVYSRKCRPVRDDVLVCKSGATTGKLAMVEVDFDFSIWSPLALVRAEVRRVRPRFLALALESDYVQEQIRRTWSAGTQPNISMGNLAQLFIVAPSIGEQEQILTWLHRETGAFGKASTRVREAIDYLKELRTALISAAVTGKIDVREAVPR